MNTSKKFNSQRNSSKAKLTSDTSKPASTKTLTTISIEDRLTELEQRLEAQAEQHALKVRELEAQLTLAQSQAVAATPSSSLSANNPTSRRKMLRRLTQAAAGLAIAGSAVAIPTTTKPAEAASGDVLLLGNSNLVSDVTYLSQTGGSTPTNIVLADWNSSSSQTMSSTAPINAAIAGVVGANMNAIGGYFTGNGSNSANLLLAPAATGTPAGAPSGNHSTGEIYVDSAGALWYCTNGGTPGTWKNISATSTLTFLTNPVRVVSNQAITGGVTSYFQIDGGTIPNNITGVFAAFSLNAQTVGGFAVVFPPDASSLPGVVTLTYGSNGSVTTTNASMVKVSQASGYPSGKYIAVYSQQSCHIYFDVFGYVV